MKFKIIAAFPWFVGLSNAAALEYQYDNSCNGAAEVNGNWYCSNSVQAIAYTGFQQAGDYLQVIDMENGQCAQAWRSFNSPLGAYGTGNDISWHLRGPLQLNEFAFYTLSQNTKQKRVHKPGFHERRHDHARFHDRNKAALHNIEERHVVSKALQKRGVCDLVSATFGTVVATWTNLWNGQSNVPASVCETQSSSTSPIDIVTPVTEFGRSTTITLTVKYVSSSTMSTTPSSSKTTSPTDSTVETPSIATPSTGPTSVAESSKESTSLATPSTETTSTPGSASGTTAIASSSSSSSMAQSAASSQSSRGQVLVEGVVTVTESTGDTSIDGTSSAVASTEQDQTRTIIVTIVSGTTTSTIHSSAQATSLSSSSDLSSKTSGTTPSPGLNPAAAASSTLSSISTGSGVSLSSSSSSKSSTSSISSVLLAGTETLVSSSTSLASSTSSLTPRSSTSSSAPQSSASVASSPASSSSSDSSTGSASSNTGSYVRQAYYSAPDKMSTGLIFLNHNGGQGSGTWDAQFGNSLSYASSDVTTGSATAQTFGGYIDDGLELVVLTDKECTSTTCGYSRPGTVAYQGFDNAESLFLLDFSMPITNKQGFNMDMPAIWTLNAQIPRTLQYGNAQCSCWESGCGEMDLFEVLDAGDDRMKATWHAANAGGSSYWFQRPQTSQKAGVLLSEANASISIFFLPDDADLAADLDPATLAAWMQSAAAEGAMFALS